MQAGAKRVIETIKTEAKRLNAPGSAIAVVDDSGNLLTLERLDDTFAAGAPISIGKARTEHWKRWEPYLSERTWGTVREDYSAGGAAWDYLPHEHARSKAYR